MDNMAQRSVERDIYIKLFNLLLSEHKNEFKNIENKKQQTDETKKSKKKSIKAENLKNEQEIQEKIEQMSRRLERGCLNKTVEECSSEQIECLWNNKIFVERYSSECARIAHNIDIKNYAKLVLKLYSDELHPKDVSYMRTCDINPDALEEEVNEITIRSQQKVQKKFSDRYTCPKCKQRKTEFEGTQTSSADEISALKLKCLNCDHFWIISG